MPVFIFISLRLGLGYLLVALPALEDVPLARDQPLRVVVLAFGDQLALLLGVDVHEHEGVLDKTVLDLVVEWGVGGETGRVVDLDHVGLTLVIDHHIQAQDVEAHVAGVVLRLAELVLVGHQGQA